MPRTYLNIILICLWTFILFTGRLHAQNIAPATEGVNWVGANNSYTQPTNGSTAANVLKYRKVSTTIANPAAGRGQWFCTLNAQASGGDVVTQNMAGGAGDGFFLTNGGGSGLIGDYTHTWGVASAASLSLNAINAVSNNSYEPVVEMGLNMSTPGYYSFVMQDSGSTKKSNLYIGYTSNSPITVSHTTASQRWVLSDRSAYLQATLSATPSSGENLYLRYKTTTNDFSVGSSTIISATLVNGTKASFSIPAQAAGSTVYYYIFSSTVSLATLNALTEGEKSLACLKYADNNGSNYSYTLPAIATIYQHLFGTNPSGSTNYTIAPNTFAANLSASAWTSTGGAFTNARGNGNSNYGLGITSVGNNTYTLTFNVASGFALSLSSFDIWLYSDQPNNQVTSITVNGITITPSIYTAPTGANASSGSLIGQTNVANPVNNITGTVTIIISLANGGNGGDFRIDNFTLYGNVAAVPSGADYVWNGSSNSSFRNSNNWTPTGVPASTDNIFISTAAANSLNITTTQTVNNLSLVGTGVLQLASGANLTIAGSLTYANTATASFNCGSTLNFTSALSQAIPALNYGNLNLAGGPRIFEAGKTTSICGNYTPTAAGTTTTGSTIQFNGTTAQAILTNPAYFDNLVIASNNSTVTSSVNMFINAGSTISINSNARLAMGLNTLDATGSTIQVNGYLKSGGLINGVDASSLFINSTGTLEYDSTRTGAADLGTIPAASWANGSTLSITGLTNPAGGTWFTTGFNQGYTNLIWNTPGLTTSPLADAALIIPGTFSIQSTGSSKLRLGSTTAGFVSCTNYNQSAGILDFSDGTASSAIHVSGDFSHTGGTITRTGTGAANTIYFDGSSTQTLSGTTSASSFIFYQFENTAGYSVNGSLPIFGTALIKTGNFSGSGNLYFNGTGVLSYDCASPRTPVSTEWPATGYPGNVIINSGINLQLDENKSSNQLTLNNGRITLGNYNLSLYDSLGQGVIPAQPFSTSNMVITNGSGKLGRAIANTQSLPITYLFPIGNNFYSPASYTFTGNSQPRVLFVNMTDATHPNLTGSDYMANHYYRTDLSEPAGTYSYSASYQYQAGDQQGTVSNIRLSRWSGLIWSNVATSSVTVPYLNSNAVNETTAPLYGPADWTGRAHVITQTYYWKFPASGAWTTSANWTPAGVPSSGDAVVFNQAGTTTVTNVPSGLFLTSMSFLGGGTITMQAGTSGIINVSGSGSPDLSIDASTTVIISGATGLTINISSGDTGIVYGKVYLRGGNHTFSATDEGSLTFKNGSYFGVGVSGGTTFTGYACGYNGNNKTTVFESGSVMEQFEGPDPFGRPDSVLFINKINFQTGSLYRYSDIGAARTPYFNGRTYADFEYNINLTKSATGAEAFRVDNFTVKLGTLNMNMNASINAINGNVSVQGTALNFNPSTGAAYWFNAAGLQTIGGTGSITLASTTSFTVATGATLQLLKNIPCNGIFSVDGTLNLGNYILSGTGNSTTYVNSGSTIIAGNAGGLTTFGNASGNLQTTYRVYSSAANYVFTNSNGITGNFFIVTTPNQNTVDSLGINTSGTVTYSGTGIGGSIYVNKLALISGNFSLGAPYYNIYIAYNGNIRSTGGRFVAGSNGGSAWFSAGLNSGGIPVYGNPEFYNAVIQDTVDFVDNATINGTIDFTASISRVLTPPKYAVGSTLRYSSGGTYARGAEWNQSTPLAAGYPHHVSVQSGTTVSLGTNAATHLETGGNLQLGYPFSRGHISMNTLAIPLIINGDLVIGDALAGGNCTMSLSTVAGGNLNLQGSYTRTSTGVFTHNSRTLTFFGSTSPSVITGPSGTETLPNLTISKTDISKQVTLASPVAVSSLFTLTTGRVLTTSTNLLSVTNASATAVNVDNIPNGYVDGPMSRQTNSTSEYTFPTGSILMSTKYRPCTVTPAVTTTTTFTATYLPATPTPNYANQLAPGLVAIDNTGTWQITRSIATNARVSLDYKNPGTNGWITPSGALTTACATCKIAVVQYNQASNPNNWNFTTAIFGGSPVMERLNTDENPIYSGAGLNVSAGLFGFGIEYANVLPVQLIGFKGVLSNGDGLLSWNVADVRDLAGFELEQSSNGSNFNKTALIATNGGLSYQFTDPQLTPGAHFYRLLVKEKSGRSFYSQVVLLTVGNIQTKIIGLKQNPVVANVSPLILSAAEQKVVFTIMDVSGHLLSTQQHTLHKGYNQLTIDLPQLPAAIYLLQVQTSDKVTATLKFIKQ